MVFREALICFILVHFMVIHQVFCIDTRRSAGEFGFVALLLNSDNSQLACIGAIISDRWILDSCADRSWYKFHYAKVGWMDSLSPDIYKITHCVISNNYKEIPFFLNGTVMTHLYATDHGIFLHKTEKSIHFNPNVTSIDLPQDFSLPGEARVVYLFNHNIVSQQLRIVKNRFCDSKLSRYFQHQQPISVKSPLYCVATRKIAFNHCCQSQALMIWMNQLIGVMAWSTACSKILGVDPWVFSQVSFYMEWIKNTTDWVKWDKSKTTRVIYHTSFK
ncbi:hypothetical protein ILUMI_13333 [Ignelater luminosus]|uniref:Peptidase S1 domain-containing protein n=1 Tax=Ignelater luminosus TaxID=2038154 RepID=A0A8K0CWX4_IGNLU|nr:hypothetical protein ILUMI_13333 [Ignelater luminosus]